MGFKIRFVRYNYDFSSVGKRLFALLVLFLLYVIISVWFTIVSRGDGFLSGLGL